MNLHPPNRGLLASAAVPGPEAEGFPVPNDPVALLEADAVELLKHGVEAITWNLEVACVQEGGMHLFGYGNGPI